MLDVTTYSKALHLFSDNGHLTADEFTRIRHGLARVERLHAAYRTFVAEHALDPEVFLPGNIWKDLYDFDGFERWTYDLVNAVRLLSPLFTGFDMLAWGRRDGREINLPEAERFHAGVMHDGALPRNLDEVLEVRFQFVTRLWYSRYLAAARRALLVNVPERYIARCPARMGEVGIVDQGDIVNPDLLTFQSRINAMVGGGVTQALEQAVARRGSATLLEIGPGLGFIPYTLHRALEGRLTVFLVDLPRMMARGYAYLAGVVGAEHVGIVTDPDEALPETPFVYIPNYLVPAVSGRLPRLDAVLNAISLNEMNAAQVDFYLGFIDAHLDEHGIFFLEQGARYRPDHEDAMAAARRRFPSHRCCPDPAVGGLPVMAYPNSYFHANRRVA